MFIASTIHPNTVDFLNEKKSPSIYFQSLKNFSLNRKVIYVALGIFTAFFFFPKLSLGICTIHTAKWLEIKTHILSSIHSQVKYVLLKQPKPQAFFHPDLRVRAILNDQYFPKQALASLTSAEEIELLKQSADDLSNYRLFIGHYLFLNQRIAVILYLLFKHPLEESLVKPLIDQCWKAALAQLDGLSALATCQLCEKLPNQSPIEFWTLEFGDGQTSTYPFYYKELLIRSSHYFKALFDKERFQDARQSHIKLYGVTKQEFTDLMNWLNNHLFSAKMTIDKALRYWLSLYNLNDYFQLGDLGHRLLEFTTLTNIPLHSHRNRAYALEFFERFKIDMKQRQPLSVEQIKYQREYRQIFKETLFNSIIASTSFFTTIGEHDLVLLEKLKLKKFEVYYTQSARLTDELFQQILPRCTHFTSLKLSSNNRLTDRALINLINFPSLCTKLLSLEFAYCNFTTTAVSKLIKQCSNLQSLNLRGCERLGDELLSEAANFAFCSTLTSFSFSRPRFYSYHYDADTAKFISACSQLKALELNEYTGAIRSLTAISQYSTHLTSLSLSTFYVENSQLFLDTAKNCKNLRCLDFSWISELKTEQIIDLVNSCSQLTSFSLSNSKLDPVSLEEIKQKLAKEHSHLSVYLS